MHPEFPSSSQKPLILSADAASGQPSMPRPAYRILIVEDAPRVAALMAKGLQRSGFVCEIVSDGDVALEKVFSENFDLMLLDLGLPGKDGRLVLEELRSWGASLPVIVVTARSLNPENDEMIYIFANEVVHKPFTMSNLIQKVRSLLKNP